MKLEVRGHGDWRAEIEEQRLENRGKFRRVNATVKVIHRFSSMAARDEFVRLALKAGKKVA